MKLKSRLIMLTAGSLAPLFLFAIAAVVLLVANERSNMERESLGRVRAAMSAIDTELDGSIATLQALAASEHLDDGNLLAFNAEARRVLATQRDWFNIGLASPSKQQLMDANMPFGVTAPFSADEEAFDVAVRTGKPAVGGVAGGTAVRAPVARVRVPIVREGTVQYVLSAPMKAEVFADLLRAQRFPDDWVIGLADRQGRWLTRIPAPPSGNDTVSADFKAALGRAPEGWYYGRTLEGLETYTAYAKSSLSGWALGVAIPATAVQAGAWRTFWIMMAGMLVALGVAIAFAWLIAREIERPIAALASAADAMGRGADVTIQGSGQIEELDRLSETFREASAAIRQREDSREREKQALEGESRALRAADSAKDEFIAMLSHELRNPLAALSSAAYILRQSKASDQRALVASEIVDRQTRQMTRLVDDLLDIGRIVTGKTTLDVQRIDLAQAIHELLETWRANDRFSARQVTLHAEPVFILADRARIEQIASNLLDNAVKFTSAKGTIRVAVRKARDVAELCIGDDGEGINAEILPRIFNLFAQGSQGLARHKGGLGIGLALVKRLVEMQGGTVMASSAGAATGSLFIARFPLIHTSDATASRLETEPVDAAGKINGLAP